MNRIGTEAEWDESDPVILKGEIAMIQEGEFVKIRVGDGIKRFSELGNNVLLSVDNLYPFELITGTVLPNLVGQDRALAFIGAQTSTQTTGGDIVTTEKLNLIGWDGNTGIWGLLFPIPIDLNGYPLKLELPAFIAPVDGDTSDVYKVLRSIFQWNITAKLISGTRFYIRRVGLESGIPSIIINSGSGTPLIKFVKGSDLSGFTNYIGTELDSATGFNGNIFLPKAMSDLISSIDFTSSSTSTSIYFFGTGNVIKVPDSYTKAETYTKTETDNKLLLKPDINTDALIHPITGQDATIYNILTKGIFSYKIYIPETVSGTNFYVRKVGVDSVSGLRSIVIGTNVDLIEFKVTAVESVSQAWIVLRGDALNSSGMSGFITMNRSIWTTINTVDYVNSSGLFIIHRSNFVLQKTVLPPVVATPKEILLPSPTYTGMANKLPLFYNKWKKRLNDVVIAVYGDSLGVRSTNNTQFTDPQYRPPLCNGKNWASAVWDKLKWGADKFWRYDALYSATPRFTEIGAFFTVETNQTDTPVNGINSTQWDDFTRREGYTRVFSGTGAASITFSMIATTVDKEASLNFIYRTDLNGSTSNTISIAEGNGRLVVYDQATSAFVEANGYVFSMRHGAVSTYRGNTKFNSTLVFKAVTDSIDSRNQAKTITITKTDTSDCRFMYWGIQTSIERYMVSIISAGRGGLELATLLPTSDDDLWDFDIDLLIQEVPINGGINTPGGADMPQFYVDEIDDFYLSASNVRSVREKSKVGGVAWQKFESVIWTPHCTLGCFQDADSFKTQKYSDGNWYGPADNRRWIAEFLTANQEDGFVFIDMFEKWLIESKAIYGNIRDGFATSSITSEDSFILDGTHQNDLGVRIMAKHINSLFDFN